jgi:Cys-rich protein (TIGR01571 family)
MLLCIFSVLGHPAMFLFQALHWSVGEYPEAGLVETLEGVLPESGRSRMEVVFAGTPEWMVWSPPDGTPDMSSRRLTRMQEPLSAGYLVGWAVSLIVTGVLVYVFASLYKTRITDKRAPWKGCPTELGLQPTAGEWKYTTFSCCDNSDYCLYGCFCGSQRLGDTYTMTNIGPSYITYIHAFVAVMVIGRVVQLAVTIMIVDLLGADANVGNGGQVGFYVGNIVLAYWMSGQRTKLRRALGDPAPEAHRAMDFCCYWCCLCCSTVQEARQVDEITGTQIKCAFKLLPLQSAPPAVVGLPVGPPCQVVVADPKQAVNVAT